MKGAYFLVAICLIGSGCSSDSVPHQDDVASRMNVQVDPRASDKVKSLVVGDLYQFMQYGISAQKGEAFDQIFQGTTTDSAINYMNDRVHYLVPRNIELSKQIVNLSDLSPVGDGGKVYVMALNVGTTLWFDSLALAPQNIGFLFGEGAVPITSSRVGIVQLEAGYTAEKSGQNVFPPLARISTLIHEARHSDCSGGLASSDVEKIKGGEYPDSKSCGHLHSICPEGHSYAGIAACDDLAWGAYAVQAVYMTSIKNDCPSCSEADQDLAAVIAADSYSRILPVDDMLNGKLGVPDMSSEGLK